LKAVSLLLSLKPSGLVSEVNNYFCLTVRSGQGRLGNCMRSFPLTPTRRWTGEPVHNWTLCH